MSVHAPITLHESTDLDRMLVSKSNKLIEGQSRLNASEQKVLAACIALINPKQAYPDGIRVKLFDYQIEALTGIEKRVMYRFIDDAARAYHSIPISTPGKKPGTVDYINIAHRSRYDPDTREFTIEFHRDMEPELLNLARYTSYGLKHMVSLRSKYAMRMYELLSKFYNAKKTKSEAQIWRVRLRDLYYQLGLEDINGKPLVKSYIASFSTFRVRVIEPAIKEINEETDLTVNFKPYRAGRSIAGLTMAVQKKNSTKSKDPENPEDKQKSADAFLAELVAAGIGEGSAQVIIDRYDLERVERNFEFFVERKNHGMPIQNPGAYLNHLVSKNIAALPDVANPYSDLYKNNRIASEYIKRIIVPVWWNLSEELREQIELMGIADCAVNGSRYAVFLKEAKSSSIDEAELFVNSPELADDMNADYEFWKKGRKAD